MSINSETNLLNTEIIQPEDNIYQRVKKRIYEIWSINPKTKSLEDELTWCVKIRDYAKASAYLWTLKLILDEKEYDIGIIEEKYNKAIKILKEEYEKNKSSYRGNEIENIIGVIDVLEKDLKSFRDPKKNLYGHKLDQKSSIIIGNEFGHSNDYPNINNITPENAEYACEEIYDYIVRSWGDDAGTQHFRGSIGPKKGYDQRTIPITFNGKPIIEPYCKYKVNYDVVDLILRNVQYSPLMVEYCDSNTSQERKEEIYSQLTDELKEIINRHEENDFILATVKRNLRRDNMPNLIAVQMLKWMQDLDNNAKQSIGALNESECKEAESIYNNIVTRKIEGYHHYINKLSGFYAENKMYKLSDLLESLNDNKEK